MTDLGEQHWCPHIDVRRFLVVAHVDVRDRHVQSDRSTGYEDVYPTEPEGASSTVRGPRFRL